MTGEDWVLLVLCAAFAGWCVIAIALLLRWLRSRPAADPLPAQAGHVSSYSALVNWHAPFEGACVLVESEHRFYVYRGGVWQPFDVKDEP